MLYKPKVIQWNQQFMMEIIACSEQTLLVVDKGKIVLTQHINFYDGDNVGNYSIKTYTSLKKYSETGEWEHEKIVLEPKNKDYKSISIDNVDCNEFKVIGEFIGIIKP